MTENNKNLFKINYNPISQKKTLAIAFACLLSYSCNSLAQEKNLFKAGANTIVIDQQREDFDAFMLRAYEGDRDAQFNVALMFSDGSGTNKDIEQAVYWYIQAARQGLASAQFNLGYKYIEGIGTVKDATKALSWWRKAALQDHERAQFNMGRAYYQGIGVEKDIERAKYWFRRAAANDEMGSRKILADVFGLPSQEIGAAVTYAEPNSRVTSQIDEVVVTSYEATSDASNTYDAPQVLEPQVATYEAVEAAEVIESVDSYESAVVSSEIIEEPVISASVETTTLPIEVIEVAEPIITEVIIYNKPKSDSSIISRQLASNLEVIKKTPNWLQVKSSEGFPVWVYDTYANIEDSWATIDGDNVNARATPKVIRGSVVGQLFNGNKLLVLDQTDKWVRVQSPKNFTAWVKRQDLAQAMGDVDSFNANQVAVKATTPITTSTIAPSITAAKTKKIASTIATLDKKKAVARNPAASAEIKTTGSYAFRNKANDNEWLFSLPAETYTLQLASFSDDDVFERYLTRNNLKSDDNMRQFISNRNNIEWKYILYGNYDSLAAANAIKSKKGFKKAWVRQVGKIRKNRCIAWKTTIPTPRELKTYCQ